MRATLPFIQTKYREFNALIFKDELPHDLPMQISRARRALGLMKTHRTSRGPFGAKVTYSISISNCYDLSERELEDVIIHEMIHLYIAVNNLRDTGPHGKIFRTMMADINRRFFRNISVRTALDEETVNSDNRYRRHYVFVSIYEGKPHVTKCARTRLFELYRAFRDWKQIESFRLYVSTSPYFNRYPNSQTLKIYGTDPAELQKALSDAVELILTTRDGRECLAPVALVR